jgi:hypothetical protein
MSNVIPSDFRELAVGQHQYREFLKQQIERDFHRAGLSDFELPENNWEQWTLKIADSCRKLDTAHQLTAALYAIDLPENWALNIALSSDYYTDLALAIIQREWVKVCWRIKYSNL